MLHLICLTKSYRLDDFECWVKFHIQSSPTIHILDNESTVDVKTICEKYDLDYHLIAGFAAQWTLFSNILNGKTDIKFAENDIVMFLDDDEYLWYDETVYSSLECALRMNFKQLGCLLIPEILMSTHHLMIGRSDVCPNVCYFHRADVSSQGKAAVLWAPWVKYSFNHGETEIGHVPWTDKYRYSDVIGSGVSKTTYGLTAYDAPLRLYHYHIKSEEDWCIKIHRGSAAKLAELGKNGNYDDEITKNRKFGGYDIPDFTMKNALEKIQKNS